MILDTSFLIDLMNEKEKAIKKLDEIEKQGKSWGVPAPTLIELWRGAKRSKKSKEEIKLIQETLENQMILKLDEESAKISAEIESELLDKGKPIDMIDCMIAGIAKKTNETLLTDNIKHFSQIENLEIETY